MKRMKITIDVANLLIELARLYGKRYITVKDLSRVLGVDIRTAGRILSRGELLGVASKISRKAIFVNTSVTSWEMQKHSYDY